MTNKVDGRIWGEGPEQKEMEIEKEGQCSSRMVSKKGKEGWQELRLERNEGGVCVCVCV